MTRFDCFLSGLHDHAARACVQSTDGSYAYAQVLEEFRRWQSELEALNVAPGSVIALRADYSVSALAALFAVLARPAVAALIPLGGNASQYLRDANATMLIDFTVDGSPHCTQLPEPPEHPLIAELAAAREGGIILFTSGSTGSPKAALHSLERFLHKYQQGRGRSLRTLAFLRFDHVAGLDTVFYTLTHGGTLVLAGRRDPESILALIDSSRVEVLPASPSFLRQLCAAIGTTARELSSLKIITYGAELMDPGTLGRLNTLFPNVRIIQKYGTTETGSPRTTSRGNDSLWLSIRSDDIEAKIIDQMLWIRSSGSTLGYLNAPSPITEDGWCCTGDLVEVDGEWIRFRGRATDIINVGGEKVSPMEVEQTILELDCVGNAVVFGEPHALLGQVVAARVSMTPRHRSDYPAGFKGSRAAYPAALPTPACSSHGAYSSRSDRRRIDQRSAQGATQAPLRQ